MTSAIGQPYDLAAQFSIGSPNAAAGTAANNGVTIAPVAPGIDNPPTIVLSQADTLTFTLTTNLRVTAAAAPFFGFINPVVAGSTSVSHNILNVETGLAMPGSPVAGGPLIAGGVPGGDVPSLGTPATLQWYTATTAPIPTPAVGTYRVLTLVRTAAPFANDVAAFMDTYFMVTP